MHYTESDDGKVIDGKTVVWIRPPGAADADDGGPREGKRGAAAEGAAPLGPAARKLAAPRTEAEAQAAKLAVADAAAAALQSAAKSGVPFCEECEQARRALAGGR